MQVINFCLDYVDGKGNFVIFHVSWINHFSFSSDKSQNSDEKLRLEKLQHCQKHWRWKHWNIETLEIDKTLKSSKSFDNIRKVPNFYFPLSLPSIQFTPLSNFIIFALAQHQKEIKALKFYFRRRIYFVRTKALLCIPKALTFFLFRSDK